MRCTTGEESNMTVHINSSSPWEADRGIRSKKGREGRERKRRVRGGERRKPRYYYNLRIDFSVSDIKRSAIRYLDRYK